MWAVSSWQVRQLVVAAVGAGLKLSFGAKLDLGSAIIGRWHCERMVHCCSILLHSPQVILGQVVI